MMMTIMLMTHTIVTVGGLLTEFVKLQGGRAANTAYVFWKLLSKSCICYIQQVFLCLCADPKSDTSMTFDGHKVIVPQGKPVNQPVYNDSQFSQSEYLIYRENQCRIRYLLKMKFWPRGTVWPTSRRCRLENKQCCDTNARFFKQLCNGVCLFYDTVSAAFSAILSPTFLLTYLLSELHINNHIKHNRLYWPCSLNGRNGLRVVLYHRSMSNITNCDSS